MVDKPHLNLIFIGHIDHGKSTTVGRLLYDTKALSEQDMKKLKEEVVKYNRPTFEFAFAMDQLKEERERGITIDIMHKDFQTPKFYFTIIDAPGHRDFVSPERARRMPRFWSYQLLTESSLRQGSTRTLRECWESGRS